VGSEQYVFVQQKHFGSRGIGTQNCSHLTTHTVFLTFFISQMTRQHLWPHDLQHWGAQATCWQHETLQALPATAGATIRRHATPTVAVINIRILDSPICLRAVEHVFF
jgi:hypothetical protein